MKRGSCVDCEEQDAYYIDDYKDELCGTCINNRKFAHIMECIDNIKERKDSNDRGNV